MSQTINSFIPVWIVTIPLLAGIIILLSGIRLRKPFWNPDYDGLLAEADVDQGEDGGGSVRNVLLMIATIVPLAMASYLYSMVQRGYTVVYNVDILPPLGLSFRVDALAQYMTLLFTFFGLIIVVYSIGYMKGAYLPQRFFGFLMFVYAGSLGVVMAGDLFSLFLFFEFMSLMYFILVVNNPTAEAVAAGMKFLFMTILAGVALFLAVVITYRETGSLALDTSGLIGELTVFSLMAFIGFLIAFGTKAAMFPLHFWMPDTYTHAPLPAALLSSAIMLKTGVYGLLRVFYNVFGVEFWGAVNWDAILLTIAAFTIIFGSTIAIAQDDIIRRLAYSGIAQVGYIILGIALLTPNGLTGALYHIMAHAFMKGCLFLCAGAIIKQVGTRSIEKMKGIGFQLPVTMLAFTVAALTAVGLPPFNLFVVKWHLSLGALDINQPVLVLILLISSFLNAAYYLPISYHAFMGLGKEQEHGEHGQHRDFRRENFKEPSPVMLVPIIVLAVGCGIFGLFVQNWPLEMVRSAIAMLF